VRSVQRHKWSDEASEPGRNLDISDVVPHERAGLIEIIKIIIKKDESKLCNLETARRLLRGA
jgi:hypothetical protein